MKPQRREEPLQAVNENIAHDAGKNQNLSLVHGRCMLPESIQEIAAVVGTERALRLIEQAPTFRDKRGRRHTTIYVPKRLKDGHPLVRVLGESDALKIVEAFGGETLKPATPDAMLRKHRDDRIRELRAAGMKVADVAWLMDVSRSTVTHVAGTAGKPPGGSSPRGRGILRAATASGPDGRPE